MSRSSHDHGAAELDGWHWEGDQLVPDPDLADRAERCRSCGEWTSAAAGAHVEHDDGLTCPTCREVNGPGHV